MDTFTRHLEDYHRYQQLPTPVPILFITNKTPNMFWLAKSVFKNIHFPIFLADKGDDAIQS